MAVAPPLAGVAVIIRVAAAVFFGHELLDLRGVFAAGHLADPDGPVHIVGVDKDVDAVHAGIPQDLVGAAAQDHAWPLLGKAQDDGPLYIVNGVLRVVVIGTGDGADALENGVSLGDVLFLGLDQLGVKAAGLSRLPNDVPVIEGNAQLLGHLLADGVAAGTVFAADGNDFVHPVYPPFHRRHGGRSLGLSYHIRLWRATEISALQAPLQHLH